MYKDFKFRLKELQAEVLRRTCRIPPRRFQLYCVGLAKTGTHSIANLLSLYRTGHEAEIDMAARVILRDAAGKCTHRDLLRFVEQRDIRLRLECDSSSLNTHFVNPILELFPEAKFILTLRDCYSWVESHMGHELRHRVQPYWRRMRELRFGGGEYAPQEQLLQQKGLYPLNGYLRYWSQQNLQVLDTVPADRLLVQRTDHISSETQRLADFLGIKSTELDLRESHSFKAPRGHSKILPQLDRDFLEDRVGEMCAPLMSRYFPEITSLDES